jgi:hypothetical protein
MPASLGSDIHWVDAGGDCHPSVIAACNDEDLSTVDLIQLDSISLGVVVPTRRNGIERDETGEISGKYHPAGYCTTGASPGY